MRGFRKKQLFGPFFSLIPLHMISIRGKKKEKRKKVKLSLKILYRRHICRAFLLLYRNGITPFFRVVPLISTYPLAYMVVVGGYWESFMFHRFVFLLFRPLVL